MIALLLALAAAAQEVDGFVEARAQAQAGVDGFPATFVERVRPSFSAPIGDRVALSTTVELIFVEGRNTEDELQRILTESDLGPYLELAGVTWPEDDNKAFHISDVADYLSVERLAVDVYLPFMDVRVGRQALNWGSSFLVNPTSPFPEILLVEPWKQRRGVNAARFTLPFRDLHQLQLVIGTDDDFRNVRAAARGTVNLLGVDVSLVGAWRQEANDGIFGLDVRGTLGVGYWFEGAVHVREGQRYEELVVGIDYSFPVLEQLVLTGQYYRNGGGSTGSSSLDALFGAYAPGLGDTEAAEPDPFAPYFKGRNYAMLAANLGIIPELGASAMWMQNLDDGSGMVVPTVTTYPRPWLEVAFAAQVPFRLWGDGGEFKPADEDLVVQVPIADGVDPIAVDFGGLVPDATFTLWTRVPF